MKHIFSRHFTVLILSGLAGLFAFIFLLDRFYPYEAANIQINRSKAVELGSLLINEQDHDLTGFDKTVIMNYSDEAFIFLQKMFGFKTAQTMMRYKNNHGLDFGWLVMWFHNLPQNAPQERFFVGISRNGSCYLYNHQYPVSFEWPRPEYAHLDSAGAYSLADEFLDQNHIEIEDYLLSHYRSTRHSTRTDHVFIWEKVNEFDPTNVELHMTIQGDRIGLFQHILQIPDNDALAIKRQSGTEYFFNTVISITVLFLAGLVTLFIFLKKYHEGEVEVRLGRLVFFVIWISFVFQALLMFRLNAAGINLGELARDGVALFIFILFVLIIRPVLSLFTFTAWGSGESLGRENFAKKFRAIDALLNKKFFTLDVARSTLQGYCAGFAALGILAILFTASLELFGCTTRLDFYTALPVSVPFLLPVLTALSGSLMAEMLFRLFGNFWLFNLLKKKTAAVLISSFFWAFYAPMFWGLRVSLYPIPYELFVWFILGLFFAVLFWRFDLWTVIIANFVTIGIMHTLPMLTTHSPNITSNGILALIFLAIPSIMIVFGFIRRERFIYKPDLMPEHIRRIAERVRMSKELEIARQVQMRLLPKENPVIDGFEVSGICLPAREVGGDYFDFIELNNNKLGIVIGDVSGKGVPAAIYMTLTKGIMQSHFEKLSPKDVLIKVNNLLYKTIDRHSFVSLFYAILDVPSKTLVFSRAGHNPVIYCNKRRDKCRMLEPEGIALGLEKGDIFNKTIKEQTIQLSPGDLLMFYTDGLTEAMNKTKEEYSEERLIQTIKKHSDKTVDIIYNEIMKDVKSFVRESPQHDDMTIVFLKMKE